MTITWHGAYTIKLASKGNTILIDPHGPETGLTPARAKVQFVALTNPSNKNMSHLGGIQGDPNILDSPGEYALDGFTLYARSWHDEDGNERSIQRWHIEDITILHLGALDRKLTTKELQEIEQSDIDILLLPIGGVTSLDTKEALDVLMTIEPSIVIPIHYKIPNLKEDVANSDQFAKEMGIDPKNKQPKFTISANKISNEGMETVLLAA